MRRRARAGVISLKKLLVVCLIQVKVGMTQANETQRRRVQKEQLGHHHVDPRRVSLCLVIHVNAHTKSVHATDILTAIFIPTE